MFGYGYQKYDINVTKIDKYFKMNNFWIFIIFFCGLILCIYGWKNNIIKMWCVSSSSSMVINELEHNTMKHHDNIIEKKNKRRREYVHLFKSSEMIKYWLFLLLFRRHFYIYDEICLISNNNIQIWIVPKNTQDAIKKISHDILLLSIF